MRPSLQTTIVYCGDSSTENGTIAAARLSATCVATRVARCERLLKETRPARALQNFHSRSARSDQGARVRRTLFLSGAMPLAVADSRRTACAQPIERGSEHAHNARRCSSTRTRRQSAIMGTGSVASLVQQHSQERASGSSVTAGLWRWRSKRPAGGLNLHQRVDEANTPAPNAAWRLFPPTRRTDTTLNFPLPPHDSVLIHRLPVSATSRLVQLRSSSRSLLLSTSAKCRHSFRPLPTFISTPPILRPCLSTP